MFVKRFIVTTLPEAMEQIRKEMGTNAMIVSSRKIRAKGFAGLLGKMVYEVVAAIEQSEQHPVEAQKMKTPVAAVQLEPQAGALIQARGAESYRKVASAAATQKSPNVSSRTSSPPRTATEELPSAQQSGPIVNQLQEIRSMLTAILIDGDGQHARRDEPLAQLTELWSATGMSRNLIERFVTSVSSSGTQDKLNLTTQGRTFLTEVLEKPGQPRLIRADDRVVGFLGPTGVGKTTTIAKLAARARLKEGRKVGLLTVDTFRVAAAQQLKTYADILGLPFVVARDHEELRTGMELLADCDLVLIDTTGRSFLDVRQAEDMKQLLAPLRFDLSYLVLSMSGRVTEAMATARSLEVVGYHALLFTKLDEAVMPTLAVSIVADTGLPLSYLAAGQHVPDDLQIADSRWLAEQLTGGEQFA